MDKEHNAVIFKNVSRNYAHIFAVNDVSFAVRNGEFFSMLGPSGSGKTTCLRLIAGFEQPSAGHVLMHGANTTGVPPYHRDVNTVFQDYALFPHMNVLNNVAYGLMVKGVAKGERQKKAQEMLEMVALGGYGERKPGQLSGGQRQRVALARALVNRPSILLLDEPLGALDLKLREQMQIELKSIQRQIGITFIYVTHDQGEALSMSDRVAVFNNGKIEQIAPPKELYEKPATPFVAGFVGISNLLPAHIAKDICQHDGPCSIRPEKILITTPDQPLLADFFATEGIVASILYLGAATRYDIDLPKGGRLTVLLSNTEKSSDPALGEKIMLSWHKQHLLRFSK